jgi:hypothetical protein
MRQTCFSMCALALPASGTMCSSLLRLSDSGGWSECYFWITEPRMEKHRSRSINKFILGREDTRRTLKLQHFRGSGVSISLYGPLSNRRF